MDCINCGGEVKSAFCPSCGQRANVHRITVRDSFSDLWHQIAGLDGLFFRTIRDLTVRPGTVAREHIRGIRVKYFGPIGYFFFMITLLLLWVSSLGMDYADLITAKQSEWVPPQSNQQAMTAITAWVADNIKWVLFLAIPFQAFAARYIFFRKSGLNIAEHAVPVFYTTGHLFWLSMLLVLYRKFTGDLPTMFSAILSIAYFGYTYATMIQYQSKVKSFFKGTGVYLIGQLLFLVTIMVLTVVIILILAKVNPDVLEFFKPSKQS